MLTSIHQDKCTIQDADQRSQAQIDYILSLSTVRQQVAGPIPLLNGKQTNVSAGPLRNMALESQLQRNSGQLLSKCNSYQQQQDARMTEGIQMTKPWEAFSAQANANPLIQFQKVPALDQVITHTKRVSDEDQYDLTAQQVYANMPWQARVGRSTAKEERPLDHRVGQVDTYLTTMQQLEDQNRKEINDKRQREAALRAYYRANPPAMSTPFA